MYNMLSVLAASSRTAMCFTLFCACGSAACCGNMKPFLQFYTRAIFLLCPSMWIPDVACVRMQILVLKELSDVTCIIALALRS